MEDFSDQIGERLQKAREGAGLTVDDVLFRTKIPRSVIVALEAGDFSVFSSPTYAKSFLSQYSGFLNVDAGLWLDALQPASFISGEFVQPLWKEAEEWKERKEERVVETSSQMNWLSGLSVLAATGVLVLLAMKGYEFLERKYGGESAPAGNTPVYGQMPGPVPVIPAMSTSAVPSLPVGVPAVPPVSRKTSDELPEPPPRAIIVR